MTAKPRTFDLDGTLPNLPVPRLEDSVQRYLDSVEPLVDASTFSDIKAASEELLQPDGAGRKLQTRSGGPRRTLRELACRVVGGRGLPELSGVARHQLFDRISTDARYAPGDQAMRAGQLTGGTLDFYLSILNETMPPEVQRDGSGLDMSLLKRFFATNRYPGTEGDRIATFGVARAGISS